MAIQTKNFFQTNNEQWEEVQEGIRRQFVGYDVTLMMVKVEFKKGAEGYIHEHFHSQTTYVAKGSFEVNLKGEKVILNEGDGFYIEPNASHGAVCLEDGILIDVFSPIREDFL